MSIAHGETLDAVQLAGIIDHTLLVPETTWGECATFLNRAVSLGVSRVCISPVLVADAARWIAEHDARLEIVTVAGFPSGAHRAELKAAEAAKAADDGAREIDFVAHLGLIKDRDWASLNAEFAQIRAAVPNSVLKVILETACLTDDEIVAACTVARDAGLNFVKTSTGFHPAGGASVHAVALMHQTVGDALGVKASGGIRTAGDVRQLFAAGATRFGLSATETVLAQWRGGVPAQQSVEAVY